MAEQIGNPAFSHMGINQAASSSTLSWWEMDKAKKPAMALLVRLFGQRNHRCIKWFSQFNAWNPYTPLGGLIPLWLMHLGEIVFGG